MIHGASVVLRFCGPVSSMVPELSCAGQLAVERIPHGGNHEQDNSDATNHEITGLRVASHKEAEGGACLQLDTDCPVAGEARRQRRSRCGERRGAIMRLTRRRADSNSPASTGMLFRGLWPSHNSSLPTEFRSGSNVFSLPPMIRQADDRQSRTHRRTRAMVNVTKLSSMVSMGADAAMQCGTSEFICSRIVMSEASKGERKGAAIGLMCFILRWSGRAEAHRRAQKQLLEDAWQARLAVDDTARRSRYLRWLALCMPHLS